MTLQERLRACRLDKDNFPRMDTERGASVSTCEEAADHIDELLALLEERDEYIVETDNWADFIESTRRNQ